MMCGDVEAARGGDVDEPLLVGIEDVHVARADDGVESCADGRLVYLVRKLGAEADMIARIGDRALAVFRRAKAVQEVFVVDEPGAEAERRVALADRDAIPRPLRRLRGFAAAPPVERIDAEAVGGEAIEAEHHASVVRTHDLQDVPRRGFDGIVLPAFAGLREDDRVRGRHRPVRHLRTDAKHLLHVPRHVRRRARHERTHPRSHHDLRHPFPRDSERLGSERHARCQQTGGQCRSTSHR